MRTPSGTLLIDALLARLGSAQASALLVRLDGWMAQHHRAIPKGPAKAGGRRTEIGIRHFNEIKASQTQKDHTS